MGQMNIKDEALIADARALAEMLGTTVTDAVRQAVAERLARERGASQDRVPLTPEQERRYQALMAISREASKLFPPGSTSDHSDLYDEHGLPR